MEGGRASVPAFPARDWEREIYPWYDIAGLEGTELYFFLIPWIFFMVVFLSIFLFLGVAVLFVQHLRHRDDS
jgi:hypothetical protein